MYTHFVLTRFNVKICHFKEQEGKIVPGEFRFDKGLDPHYLKVRFHLFESYCYPSLRQQVCQNFKWLVFFDEGTPPKFKERIAEYSKWPAFVPIFVAGALPASISEVPTARDLRQTGCALDTHGYHKALSAHLDGSSGCVITTRLDNDDAVAKNFIASIQREISGRHFEILNFQYGYTLSNGRLYLTAWDSNPFLSVVETLEKGEGVMALRTALWRNHPSMCSMDNYRSVESRPLWMRVSHGSNLSDLPVVGHRQQIVRLKDNFAIAEAVMPDKEHWPSYCLEQMIYYSKVAGAFGKFALKRILLRKPVHLKDYLLQIVRQ